MGGGRAPEGRSGALLAVLAAIPEAHHMKLRRRFVEKAGSEFCRELKGKWRRQRSLRRGGRSDSGRVDVASKGGERK